MPPFAYEAYIRGELAMAAGDAGQAALQFELATAAPEEDAYLLTRLAEAQAQSGEHDAAERSLAEAERVNPCEASVWLTRGRWSVASGNLDAAARAYRTAIACAPHSAKARIALYGVLAAQGKHAESLALLRGAAGDRDAATLRVALVDALSHRGVAEVRFALDNWESVGAVDRSLIERLARRAIARSEAALALSLNGWVLELEPLLRAKLAALLHDRDTLRALLSQTHERAMGGPETAARFALAAHDFERAELYASLPDPQASEDVLRTLRVEALWALGESETALQELRRVQDAKQRRRLAAQELSALGLPVLSEELRQ